MHLDPRKYICFQLISVNRLLQFTPKLSEQEQGRERKKSEKLILRCSKEKVYQSFWKTHAETAKKHPSF